MTIAFSVYQSGDFRLLVGEFDLDLNEKTIHLPFDLSNYKIFLQIRSYNLGYLTNNSTQDSACAYLTWVGDGYFKCKIYDPNATTHSHPTETVSAIIAKDGLYQIDGKYVWVTQVYGTNQTVPLPVTFPTTPVVFATVYTEGLNQYGVVRISNRTTSSFDITVQDVEGVPPKINLLVMETGYYPSLKTYVSTFSADHTPHTCSIPPKFVRPEVLLQCQTINGGQPCWMRAKEIKANAILGQVEEPPGWDGWHVVETCACFVADNSFYYSSIKTPTNINAVIVGSNVFGTT